MRSKSSLLLCFVVLSMFLLAGFANAGTFSSVVVYGDSLSDNGNLYGVTGYPPYPYYNGRFSNGIVGVEYLANNLGAPLHDFAWGGATTGVGNYVDGGNQTTLGYLGLPGMQLQLASSVAMLPPIAPTSLFVLWGGPNDFLADGFSSHTADVAVYNLTSMVATLESVGATHILVVGMPDLGLTPDFYGNPDVTALSFYFNQQLQAQLPVGVTYVDTFNLMHAVAADPAAYGFTNVTNPCFDGVTVCAIPDQYLFWDGFHPTTSADRILGQAFTQAAVPEPSTLAFLGFGIAGLAGLIRRK